MALEDDIAAAWTEAGRQSENGEELVGVVPTEPLGGQRVYLCAYARGEETVWLALDAGGRPVGDRKLVRDAVAIAALCELAEESAGGGDIGSLRARLAELRVAENPEGIEAAEAAAAELEDTVQQPPRIASVAYLDAVGRAAAKLEQTLGEVGGSPFAEAMKSGMAATDDLADDVTRRYKRPLA